VAERVARCADEFLGAVLHDWVAVDPREAATDVPTLALQRLAREQLACALPQRVSESSFGALGEGALRSALPAQVSPAGHGLRRSA
jgi:flagellar biosynthesis protein FlhG